MFVVGTAGHVDHGKSTLVQNLTGVPMDRLAQEKARGMTIDLNFAHLDLPLFGKVGLVDVPGHQRFVKNMVSGVTALDAFCFVVAADDGWMPQSEEHLRILHGLGRQAGIVVLSKVDLVDEAHRAEVRAEILARFLALGLPPPRIVDYSAKWPATLAAVRQALAQTLVALPPRSQNRGARLWVDRTFLPLGAGVVVTGTLLEGTLELGMALHAWPMKKSVTVRGLQNYGQKIERVSASSRVALSLSGASGIERGALLSERADALTAFFEARLTFWEKVPKRNFTAFLHAGTAKVAATILDVGEGYRVKLETPWPLRAGERFLIRAAGEERSLGAGLVTDPFPRRGTKAQACASIAAYGEGLVAWTEFLERKGPVISVPELMAHVDFESNTEERLCDTLQYFRLASHRLLRFDQWQKVTEPWHSHLVGLVQKNRDPLSAAQVVQCLIKVMKSQWRVTEKQARELADTLLENGEGKVWTKVGASYLPVGVTLSPSPEEDRAKAEVRSALAAKPGVPVAFKEWAMAQKERKAALKKLVAEGEIVGLGEGFYLSSPDFAQVRRKVTRYLADNPGATTPQLRDELGLSRRDAVLILEKCDGEGLTRFAGNGRTLTPLAESLL